jgi:hypothetical protein
VQDPGAFLFVLVLLGALVALIGWPLRPGREERALERDEGRREELDAAREAKYRQIREIELDHRTGKLTDGDWRAQDRALRAEAVEILRELDELDGDREPVGAERLPS